MRIGGHGMRLSFVNMTTSVDLSTQFTHFLWLLANLSSSFYPSLAMSRQLWWLPSLTESYCETRLGTGEARHTASPFLPQHSPLLHKSRFIRRFPLLFREKQISIYSSNQILHWEIQTFAPLGSKSTLIDLLHLLPQQQNGIRKWRWGCSNFLGRKWSPTLALTNKAKSGSTWKSNRRKVDERNITISSHDSLSSALTHLLQFPQDWVFVGVGLNIQSFFD